MAAITHAQRQQEQAESLLWRLLARELDVSVEEARRRPEARILGRALGRIHLRRTWPLRAAVDTLPLAVACAVVSYARYQLVFDPCLLFLWIERHEAALMVPDRLVGQPEQIAWARTSADVRSWLGALQADRVPASEVGTLARSLIEWI